MKGPILTGLLGIGSVIAIAAIWGGNSTIAGAVVVPGNVEMRNDRHVIQHPDGGVIVSEILVGEGDQVLAGDVLVRLDDTFLVSDLAIVERQLLEIFIRKARFDAERLDQQNFLVTSFPDFARLDNAWALSSNRWTAGTLQGAARRFGKRDRTTSPSTGPITRSD